MDTPPFLTFKEPFCACVVEEVSLSSRMRNMWPFISYLGRAQLLLPPAILDYLSTGDELQRLSPRPIYLLPQIQADRRLLGSLSGSRSGAGAPLLLTDRKSLLPGLESVCPDSFSCWVCHSMLSVPRSPLGGPLAWVPSQCTAAGPASCAQGKPS